MADPLQLLREYTIKNKKTEENATQIIFDDLAADRKSETNYRAKDGGYYTLESVWFLLQRAHLPHAKYIIDCKSNGIPPVTLLDKKSLLEYMRGEKESDDRIDFTKFGGVVAKVSRAANADEPESVKRVKLDQDLLEDKKRHAERLEATTTERPLTLTENIKPLSEKLSRERVAEIRALRLAQKRQSIRVTEDDIAATQQRTFLQADESATRDIVSRERLLRTRESILQSKRKRFDDVLKVLAGVRQREEAAARANAKKQQSYNRYEVREKDFWKERGAETEEFQIDTSGGFLSRSKGKAPQQPDRTPRPAAAAPAANGAPKAKALAMPIILVSNAPTALLTLYNAKEFLENGQYVPSEEMKNKLGGKKPQSVTVYRRVGDKKVPFLVCDSADKFKESDWKRVVACFCHGAKWQFKGWAWNGDPAEIFSHVKGFHMMNDDAKLEPTVQGWAVQVLQVNRRKRWLDKTAYRSFWDGLDEFLAKRNMSHLALS